MNILWKGSLIFKLICLIVLKIDNVSGQSIATSIIREIGGRSKTYQNQGFVPHPDCHHDRMQVQLNPSDLASFTTCFLEFARHGQISQNPDQYKRTDRLIRDHGYYFITYNNLTSKDGYIQTLFRITGSPKSPPRRGKPAVLLFHGIFFSSDAWLLLGEKSLPFKLANAGYEVWLANARGTDYSQRHVTFNPTWNLDYWDFSFHEMGVYDLPIIIDKMIVETGREKVFFIGHSLGGLVYSAGVAELPYLNDKIQASFLLSPANLLYGATTPLRLVTLLVDLKPWMQKFINAALLGRVTVGNVLLNVLESQFCSLSAVTCSLCGTSIFALVGFDKSQVQHVELPHMLSTAPNSIPFKLLLHGSQIYRNCEFSKFDYGPGKNFKIYGQAEPPLYNLRNVRAPLHIYYAENDNVVSIKSLQRFKDSYPPGTVKGFHRVNWKRFTHYDFLVAKDADILVYNKLLDDMKQYI